MRVVFNELKIDSNLGEHLFDLRLERRHYKCLNTYYGAIFNPCSPDCFDPDTLEIVVVLAFWTKIPRLPANREWFALRHQAGGHSCEQYHFVATRILPRSSLYPALRQVARDRCPGGRAGWDGSHFCAAELAVNPDEVELYRSEMAKLHLTYTGSWLTESIYPFDATPENLRVITDERLEMHDFGLIYPDDVKNTGAVFLVITENSD